MRSLPFLVRALALAVGGVLALASPDAEAIPAFARKYQTSCQTCHTAYPKLNPFGQAFRLLGYRMPAETEELVKESPVKLGAPGYKKLWPNAVWPGDIPGTVPFSLSTDFTSVSQRKAEEEAEGEEKQTIKSDFRFPEEVALLAGGTLGETLSFFGEIGFEREVEAGREESVIEIEHAQLNFNGLGGSAPAFNLKVGRFAPELAQPFGHSSVLLTGEAPAVIGFFNPIAPEGGAEVGGEHGGGIAVPHLVDGLEIYGIAKHRFLYSVGIANGIGPGADSFDGNNAKDVYGRLAYKFGGLALDGEGYVPSDKNWRERSVQLGIFAYRGDGKGIFFAAAHEEAGAAPEVVEDQTFYRFGAEANVYVQDLNLNLGYLHGRDTLAIFELMGEERELHERGRFDYDAWFAEADYVFSPWLHGGLRYEWLRPAREGAPDFKRITANLTPLIRANVVALVEYQRNLGESDDFVLLGNLRFAF